MTILTQTMEIIGKRFGGVVPERVSTRDLSRATTKVLGKIKETCVPAVVTYRGQPSFIIVPLEQDDLLSLVLAMSPQLLADDTAAAEKALKEGDVFAVPSAIPTVR